MNVIDIENSEDVNVVGTSLMGYVKTTYADLEEKLGFPTSTYGDKTTVEWNLMIAVDSDGEGGDFDYVTATIYDYKTDYPPTGEYDWHIGGFSKKAVEAVEGALETDKPLGDLSWWIGEPL